MRPHAAAPTAAACGRLPRAHRLAAAFAAAGLGFAVGCMDFGDPVLQEDDGPSADLAVAKQGPGIVSAADTLTYLITTTNFGPNEAVQVRLSDLLPAGVTFISASRGAAESGGAVGWSALGALPSGSSVVDTVRVLAPASGTLLNVARATSDTRDPDPTNNDGSEPASRTATIVRGADSVHTVSFAPVRDNTLYEDAQGDLSNGRGSGMFVGTTESRGGRARRRALVAFAVTDSIPAGATIRNVQLQLTVSRTIVGARAVRLHRLLADWGEGASAAAGHGGAGGPARANDATWLHRFYSSVFWSAPGGDFASTASAQIQVTGNGRYTWGSTAAMVADVQSWIDGPAGNFGWIMIGEELGSTSTKRFETRESPVAANRPRLLVEFSTPTQVATRPPIRSADHGR